MLKNPVRSPETPSEPLVLNRLGNYLLQYFPLNQVLEILEDYREYLSLGKERGSSEKLTEELEDPKAIARELLNETPAGLRRFWTWTLGFGTLAALALYLCISPLSFRLPYMSARFPLAVLLSLSLFSLFHGRARAVLERRFSISPPLGKAFWFLQLLIPAVTFLTEALMQWLLTLPVGNVPVMIGKWPVGIVTDFVLCLFLFLLCLLFLWILFQTLTRSVRYYSGAVHTLGGILFLLDIRAFLHSMNPDRHVDVLHRELLLPLWLYGAAALLALLFAFFLRVKE